MSPRRIDRIQGSGVTPMSTTFDVPTLANLVADAGNLDNKKAREAFSERYAPLIHKWCRKHCRGLQEADQEDIVQRIWVRLFEVLPQYDPSKRFRGWLHTIIKHTIVDLHRERERHPAGHGSGATGILNQLHEVPAPDNPAVEDLTRERHPAGHGSGATGIPGQLHEVPAPDDPAVEDLTRMLAELMELDQQALEACKRILQRVEPNTWRAFWLTTVKGQSAADVAQQLKMKKGTVLVYKRRVIKMIQSEIEGPAG
jgi:RNA polymerase sigma-70 factor, ECF subfamily